MWNAKCEEFHLDLPRAAAARLAAALPERRPAMSKGDTSLFPLVIDHTRVGEEPWKKMRQGAVGLEVEVVDGGYDEL